MVKTSLEEITQQKFISAVDVNGERRCVCKIWAGDDNLFGGRNRKTLYATRHIQVDNDGMHNESLNAENDGVEQYLQATGMLAWGDTKTFSPDKAANHLWKNFISGLE